MTTPATDPTTFSTDTDPRPVAAVTSDGTWTLGAPSTGLQTATHTLQSVDVPCPRPTVEVHPAAFFATGLVLGAVVVLAWVRRNPGA